MAYDSNNINRFKYFTISLYIFFYTLADTLGRFIP